MNIIEVGSLTDMQAGLVTLLTDCVDSGASIGFIPPLTTAEAVQYWDGVESALATGSKRLIVAVDDATVLGAVQIETLDKPNSRHRAEVQKLMVLTSARGRGVGKQLMIAIEAKARASNLSLLVLDTRKGDVASNLYRGLGFIEAGEIPQFASNVNGELEATVFFYKILE